MSDEKAGPVRDDLVRGIVKVKDGRGFVLDGCNQIVTAAHCVTRQSNFNPQQPWDTTSLRVSTLDDSIACTVLVVFMDTMSDLALLGIESLTGGGELVGQFADEWQSLMQSVRPLRAELEPPESDAFTLERRVQLFTHEGEWVSGVARICPRLNQPIMHATMDKPVTGGTSGSPVFSDSGEVLGLVSNSSDRSTNAVFCDLRLAMPYWFRIEHEHFREADNDDP